MVEFKSLRHHQAAKIHTHIPEQTHTDIQARIKAYSKRLRTLFIWKLRLYWPSNHIIRMRNRKEQNEEEEEKCSNVHTAYVCEHVTSSQYTVNKALEVIICFFFSVQFRLCEPFCLFHYSFLSFQFDSLVVFFFFFFLICFFVRILDIFSCCADLYTLTQFTCLLFSGYTFFGLSITFVDLSHSLGCISSCLYLSVSVFLSTI